MAFRERDMAMISAAALKLSTMAKTASKESIEP